MRSGLYFLAAIPVLLALGALILIPLTPNVSDMRKNASEHPTQVFFADGKKLTEFKESNRVWVKLSDISPHVVNALIATEDRRFYDHHGLDWWRTVGALFNTLHGNRQGGSTLTQQLARNLFPEEIGRAPTLSRKLKEAVTAFKIEAMHSKNDILETYLNTVPFLYNAYGIEMAARTYFDTSAAKLDELQSATLVGMLKGNTYYNPVLNPERALERRNLVLALMLKQQKLPQGKFESLKKKPLGLDFERQTEGTGPAPHFARQLRNWLVDWADRNGYSIYGDGLVVRTTLDSRLQALANQAVTKHGLKLQELATAAWSKRTAWNPDDPLIQSFIRESPDYGAAIVRGLTPEQAMKQLQSDAAFMRTLREQKTRLQVGFMAIDPQNGHIKAWVGSRNFEQDPFDHVQQARRQPGSTFKPFVYGEAFRQGLSPGDTLMDQPVEIALSGGNVWRPRDGTPPSGEAMRLSDGLAYSKNTITAQLMMKVGPANVAALARAMGVRQSPLETVPSLALGTSPVTLKEMVAAYGTIANNGGYLEPVMVTRIEDRNGRILEQFSPAAPEEALPRDAAFKLLDAMRGVISRGTGSGVRARIGTPADLAGKTGTTQGNTDGWFILMHRQLVGGAWVGFNDGRITLKSDYWGQGAHSALPIVAEVFSGALHSRTIDARARFDAPEAVDEPDPLLGRVRSWFSDLFSNDPAPPKPDRGAKPPARPAPPPEAPPPVIL
ncbi:MAG: penicillin-binding protein 1A [Betaproteobacteria bacterium]